MILNFILVITTLMIFMAFAILAEFNQGTYNSTKKMGYYEKEGLKNYQKDYPNKKIKDLKLEIEEIANRLVDNQSSNRYTERLREKAYYDKDIQKLNDEFVDKVRIVKYNDKKLRAKIDYIIEDKKYSLLFDMVTVSTGRVFLKKYNILKENASLEKII